MGYKYIGVPTHISYKDCADNGFVFAPSKYTRFLPSDTSLFVPMSQVCTESKKKVQTKRGQVYLYSEIGDINVNTGLVDESKFYGLNLPSENPKQCQDGDILISTVRTYRGGFGILKSKGTNNCCSPAILVIRDVAPEITKEYLLAILRTDFVIEQILGFQNRGMYPRLDSDAMDKVLIPIPKDYNVIRYVSLLMQAIISKEELIKQRHAAILSLIDDELRNNQKENTFTYHLPTFQDLQSVGRLDTGLYSPEFKEGIKQIKQYKGGYNENIYALGYRLSRGQNLQESNIGKSIYSEHPYKNFYSLALPTNFSDYGTINKTLYLGNPNKLKTLSVGEIVFGAEATFRGFVVCNAEEKCITNIHGVTISNNGNLTQSIFVKCFLDYLVQRGIIDCVKVGGHGGSFAQKYWNIIPFPSFPDTKQKEIAKLYHNPQAYPTEQITLDNFISLDDEYNAEAGIYELDKTAKHLQELLSNAIDDVVNDREIAIMF